MALSNFPSTAVRDSRDDDKGEEEGEQNTRYKHDGRPANLIWTNMAFADRMYNTKT